MKPIRLAACLLCLLFTAAASAQSAAPAAASSPMPAGQGAEAGTVADGEQAEDKDWRDTSGYPFGALADTVLRLELVAQAMQLRDFCANRRVPDDFVRERLRRFSALSGRPEDCRTLLDY